MRAFRVNMNDPDDSVDMELKWLCGCKMKAIRELETDDVIVVGSIDFPIRCPEHDAPFTPEVMAFLLTNNPILYIHIWSKYRCT